MKCRSVDCFNPYSNGFSSFIRKSGNGIEKYWYVSILILMDSLLLFYYDVSCRIDYHCVSILILMDSLLLSRIKKLVNLDLENVSILILMDSLLLFKCYVIQLYELLCFNPYSNGFSSFIKDKEVGEFRFRKCFNPYSNGFSSFI